MPVLAESAPGAFELFGHGPEPHVDMPPGFGDIPGVPGQTGIEKPEMAIRILPVVGKFLLISCGLQPAAARIEPLEQVAIDRAGRTGRADEVFAAVFVVDHVIAVCLAHVAHLVL